MITKEFFYKETLNSEWRSVRLTPDEIDMICDYLDSITTPSLTKRITLPFPMFFPAIPCYAFKWGNSIWNITDLWEIKNGK